MISFRAVRWASLFLTVGFLLASRADAISTGIVISQAYGGGGNAGATFKNDFIELFNRGPAAVNVTGWSVQYASAAGTTWAVTNLVSATIQPGQYYLVQEAVGAGGTVNLPTPDATGTTAMSATAAKVALVNSTTALTGACPTGASIVDFVGYGATATCFEGAAAAPAPSNTTAVLRAVNGCTDTDGNSGDFASGAPNPRNTATTLNPCGGGSTGPTGVGLASPSSGAAGSSTLLTVTVTPGTSPPSTGLAVSADLSTIGGSATQGFFDDGTNGDVTTGDNIFSFNVASVVGTGGLKSLPVSITDAQARTGNTSISYTIVALVAIHDIQGSGTTSPLVGNTVSTRGIVTALRSNGFFLQTPDAQADGDPNTSEGIFVFTSSAPPASAAVGNDLTLSATVQEFIPASDPLSPPVTELGSPSGFVVNSTSNPLPTPVILTSGQTTTTNIENLERFEGMRVHVDSLTVVAPTQGTITESSATSVTNGTFYTVVTGVPRPFREPGIEANDPAPGGSGVTICPTGTPNCVPRFDFNPERLRVDSDAQPGAAAIEVSTGAVLANVTGVLDYGFRTYTILPDPSPAPTVTPGMTATPVTAPSVFEFTVASANLERFFDTADDPSVSDVVLTPTAFNNRLNKASLAIRDFMRTPDIIGVEEMENLTTLQALATKVNNDAVTASQPNPNYQAFLVEGNDIGGIDVGFLVKAARVSVVDVTQFGKLTTYIDPGTGLPATLNDRPPLVLHATITGPSAATFPVTVIVNHLRSLSAVDDPVDGNRVRTKRRAQAEDLASLAQTYQGENLVVLGDFNAFEFNDGYVDGLGTIMGTPTPAGQVVLASSAIPIVTPPLTNLDGTPPASERYSYTFDGDAQTLDHVLVNAAMVAGTTAQRIEHARINADFPETLRSDPNRPERISDHDPVVAYFQVATFPVTLMGFTAE